MMVEPQYPRKLAAIFYADVEGYSRLTQEDEVGTYRRLRAYLNVIESYIEAHHGRVVHYAGDAVLADFAMVTDALSSAVNIQAELKQRNSDLPENRKVRFRIGLNLGEVLIDGHEIYGDGVNIAARLQARAEPGGICISNAVFEAVGDKLPLDYEAMGPQHLKNISEPTESYHVRFKSGVEFPRTARIAERPATEEPEPIAQPTIAVLPFTNLSGDPKQDYFSDGISEDIITELSRFRSLSVLARASSFAYRGPTDIKKVGQELGVQYILEGSVRRLAERIRITARLVECESTRELWGERYDMEAEKLFAIQDDVIGRIVGMLENRLAYERLAIAKRVMPRNPRAYDYWLRGNQLMEDWTADSDNQAIPMFEKAISLDPNFARAYSSLAGIYQSRNLLSPGNPRDEQDRALALKYSHEAVRLDPVDARSHVNLAWGYMLARDFENGKRHFDLAGELNPNDASITITRGLAAAYLGDAASGIKLADRAIRLNPIHPDFFLGNLASIYFLAGRFEDTISTIDLAPSVWPEIAAWRTAACAHLGRVDEAKHWGVRFVSDVRSNWIGEAQATPLDSVSWFFQINAIKRREDIALLADGLAAAGLPRPTGVPGAPTGRVGTNSDSEPVGC